jgi:hypothetical protein
MNSHSFNLSHNINCGSSLSKKSGKFKKNVKQSALHSYTNMTKKKQTRATSNTTNTTNKTNNILFKLASELSQSPDAVKVRKAYGKDNKISSGIKTVSAFGIPRNSSGNRMNTEATDDASLNSGRNRNKSQRMLEEAKTPDSKGGRTISYNNEFDQYSKSRNDDAITCKRDHSKYATSISESNVSKTMDSQLKKRVNYLHTSNENVLHNKQVDSLEAKKNNYLIPSAIDSFENHFERCAEPLEEIARVNPNLIPLLKLVRKGYEEACHKVVVEEKHNLKNESINKLKQEVSLLKRERNLTQKEKDTVERDLKQYKTDLKNTQDVVKKLKYNYDRKIGKIEKENLDLKRIIEEVRKKDFDLLRKIDLDEYNLTSDDLRSERNKKHVIKANDTKGHPLVPKLDFKKLHEWRDQSQQDEAQDDDAEEEEEEEELLTENEQYLFKGSELQSNASVMRNQELEKRKEDVIAILNKTYADEEQPSGHDLTDELSSFQDNEVLFHDVAPEYEQSVNQHKYHSNGIDDRSLSA